MSKELVCMECGRNLGGMSVFEFEENIYCDECFRRLTVLCDCCETRIWRDNAEGDSFIPLCRHCYDYEYTNCERCGTLLHNDDALYEDDSDYPYCQECYERIMSEPIKSYCYKPEPIFYGDNSKFFYGIELELDLGGEDSSKAQKLLDHINQDNTYIYAKHDGSLTNGFELVTYPMTLDHHLNEVDYSSLFEKSVAMGYRSHQTETCGLHIHVNRTAFGDSREEQEEVIARIVFFVEKHWCELLKASRRTEYNINRWASRYGISENAQNTYKKAKERHLGRYVAVNLENYNTIEFRIFRGTLRYQTFIATLQLVDEICHVCTYLNDKELEGLSWSSFVLGIYDKPELIGYLKSKRLYVNELPTEEQEEM